ncbi:hypothetical protein [Bacillus sp. 165]|uniref:hypothetical protein n=1 Tax=Bacillus sp. 165 TaxID=1529117 RepID=UPI001ADD3336|nr:hypothetical protein [Bacillus sp. 165]MBO9129391.1 hypothetical protein [Bacillus sp. 165]
MIYPCFRQFETGTAITWASIQDTFHALQAQHPFLTHHIPHHTTHYPDIYYVIYPGDLSTIPLGVTYYF